MYFLIGLFIFTALVIGVNFCFLLIGGTPFQKGEEFAPVKMGRQTYTVERFAVAVSTSAFGVSWLLAWVYFLSAGWESFNNQLSSLLFHVVLQLVAALALLVAGIGLFRQWKSSKYLFMTAMGVLLGSVVIAIAVYGPQGHGDPIFMYLFSAWTFVVGGFLTVATYLLDKLTHQWEGEKTTQASIKPLST